MAILDRAIVRLLPAVPKPVVRRLSSRYIAGPFLDDAVRVVEELNSEGKLATIDVLGEQTESRRGAEAIASAYEESLIAIDRGGLEANVSIKLTGFGLGIGYELCRELVVRVVRTAAAHGNSVRIEMEDATTTDDTLRLYRELRESGHDNIGTVLQSSLRRTQADARALADLRPSIRLVKGIYVESSELQFKEFEAVRANYVATLDALIGSGCYAAIATHDEWLIEQALERVRGLERGTYEFQMLLGVRPDLGDRLVAEGHPLRIYVPFGRQWYEYSIRRLQENPKIAGYIASDTVRRVFS